jgi:hypothetical protein
MAIRKKYKKKTRGIDYVARILNKYAKKKFPSLQKARGRAKEILALLKESKQKVTVKTVMSFVRKKRESTLALPEYFTTPQHYFALVDYPSSILVDVSNKVKFKSKLSRKDLPLIKGGTEPSYDDYFSGYVRYINKLISLQVENNNTSWGTNSENYYVKCTPLDKDNVSYIVGCDSNGYEFDYGYDTESPDFVPSEAPIIDVKKTTAKKETKGTSDIDKEIELSKQRQAEKELDIKKMDKVIELMKAGFTKEEIMKMFEK